MSWINRTPKEALNLDREEYTPEKWKVLSELFCEGKDVDVIHVHINKIEYFEN